MLFASRLACDNLLQQLLEGQTQVGIAVTHKEKGYHNSDSRSPNLETDATYGFATGLSHEEGLDEVKRGGKTEADKITKMMNKVIFRSVEQLLR